MVKSFSKLIEVYVGLVCAALQLYVLTVLWTNKPISPAYLQTFYRM